jgi:hypothetical protein
VLIILNGVETVHKKWFAGRLLAALNTFVVDGYTVDFKKQPFEISTAEGEVVYGSETNKMLLNEEDGSANEAGNITFSKILQMEKDIFLDGCRDNHYANAFVDIEYDFGISNTVDYPTFPLLNSPDVVSNYNNRTVENFVISGSFSRVFIEQMFTAIGRENVKIINIIRHPIVAYLMHEKPPEYYVKNSTYTKEHDGEKLIKSIINAANLIQFEDVVTVKFEDILRDGYFMFNGHQIDLPPTHVKFNEWLTQFEMNEVIPTRTDNPQALANLDEATTVLSNLAELREQPRMIKNVFSTMGYDTLEFEDIIEPNAS